MLKTALLRRRLLRPHGREGAQCAGVTFSVAAKRKSVHLFQRTITSSTRRLQNNVKNIAENGASSSSNSTAVGTSKAKDPKWERKKQIGIALGVLAALIGVPSYMASNLHDDDLFERHMQEK